MFPLYDINPTRRPPVVTVGLIAVNVVVFLLQVTLTPAAREQLVYTAGVVPAAWTGMAPYHQSPLAFLTCMFLHGSFAHIFGNMWFFWIFGNNIEDALGHVRFLFFYLLCGVAATFAHVAVNPASDLPVIGASGAISGVLGAYLLFYPRARIIGMIIIIPFLWMPRFIVTAFFFLVYYFAMQVLMASMQSHQGAGVAFWAHIGGFVVGLLAAMVLRPRRKRPDYRSV